MTDAERDQLMRDELSGDLKADLERIRRIFAADRDEDIQFREFTFAGSDACLVFVDGLVNSDWLQEYVLRPGMRCPAWDGPANQRLDYAQKHVIHIASIQTTGQLSGAVRSILSGMAALLIDGCAEIAIMETRKYPTRSVDKPESEAAVQGPHEGFTENLRDNISMIRRYLNTPKLMTQMIDVGTEIPTRFALLHVQGVAQERVVEAVLSRIRSVREARVPGLGQLQQLIEDRPYALLPQMMLTERPDRVAAALANGQVAILSENSPYTLLAPMTVFQQLHAADDYFERWQYGSFQRVVRIAAMLMSVYLPGLYVAITQFHSHLIPMELLSSIAEARANVPFSLLAEVLIMEFSFALINEAGIRIPNQIGTALGIVGALILGQAAVEANIISPIIIIIVAITGLGNYAIPNYGFSKGIEMYRLVILTAATALGLPGIAIATVMILAHLAGMHSFGVPYLAPVTPVRRPKSSLIVRWPSLVDRYGTFMAARRNRKKQREATR
ncbi:MAG: spore germination protein [Clostridia bacterium]|nr:spore germination protein [Clostridia bacterium]